MSDHLSHEAEMDRLERFFGRQEQRLLDQISELQTRNLELMTENQALIASHDDMANRARELIDANDHLRSRLQELSLENDRLQARVHELSVDLLNERANS